jgi:hypothetical protein
MDNIRPSRAAFISTVMDCLLQGTDEDMHKNVAYLRRPMAPHWPGWVKYKPPLVFIDRVDFARQIAEYMAAFQPRL